MCPEERTEVRLLIPSLTTSLYLSNSFHSRFLHAWCKAIQFFFPLLLLFSTDRLPFQSFSRLCLFLQTENCSCFYTLHPPSFSFSIQLKVKSRLVSTGLVSPRKTHEVKTDFSAMHCTRSESIHQKAGAGNPNPQCIHHRTSCFSLSACSINWIAISG